MGNLHFVKNILLCLWSMSFLAGCQQAPTVHPILGIKAGTVPSEHDHFSQPGPNKYKVSQHKISSQTGCQLNYLRYTPIINNNENTTKSSQPGQVPIVILSHGYHRTTYRMKGYAEHFASKGLESLIVKECFLRLNLIKKSRKNTEDLLALSKHLNRPIIYVGFSGGGLSSLLAASKDENVVGYLGLDPGGWKNFGIPEIKTIEAPVAGIFGPPKLCNVNGRGAAILREKKSAYLHYLPDSRHCHFEKPSSSICQIFCGKGEKLRTRKALEKEIMVLATAFVLWQAGLDLRGENVWVEKS